MFGKPPRPAPGAAVHVTTNDSSRSLCGQSMQGEPEMPGGTKVTCKPCAKQAKRRHLDINCDEI
jgi:hypothetical protein